MNRSELFGCSSTTLNLGSSRIKSPEIMARETWQMSVAVLSL